MLLRLEWDPEAMRVEPVGLVVTVLLVGKRPLAILFETSVVRRLDVDGLILEVECIFFDIVTGVGNEL